MFEIIDFLESAICLMCEKDANLVVRCSAGTLNGPLCGKCLLRQVKARKAAKSNGKPMDPTPAELFAK